MTENQDVRCLEQFIADFISSYRQQNPIQTNWRQPLVGLAAANDPWFEKVHYELNPACDLPRQILPSAQTVISFFLPFEAEMVQGNIGGKDVSDGWTFAYKETNDIINEIAKALQQQQIAAGFEAYAFAATYNYDKSALTSGWSHRSAAWVAGLGTFGVNNMLITRSGSCGRLGSVLTSAKMLPTLRPDHEYCLEKAGFKCGKCLKQCPSGAVHQEGDSIVCDRFQCNDFIYGRELKYPIGQGDCCGKCMSGVPCSLVNPH